MPRRTAATETDQDRAYAIGRAIQIRAADHDRKLSPQELDHGAFLERLDRIGRDAPAVRTAWVLLDQRGVLPVPLDRELEPAGKPLETTDAILDHWAANPDHTIGIATGPHPARPWTYIAVQVDRFGLWTDWLRDAAKVTEKVPDLGGFAQTHEGMAEVGPPIEKTRHRWTGAYSRLLWVPPPLPGLTRYRADAAGGDLVKRMELQKVGRGGWIWIAAPDPDGDLKLRKNREVTGGVRVLATGTVVPWESARTTDGWSLRLEAPTRSQDGLAPPKGDPVAPWLLDKLTRR